MKYCDLEKLQDGSWFCRNCGWNGRSKLYDRTKLKIHRICGGNGLNTFIPQMNLETIFIDQIANKLNGRTIDEALAYLEICKSCPKYKGTYCGRDRGCDKQQVFIARLARGYCKERWDNPAKNSVAHKYFTTGELAQAAYELIQLIPHDIDLIAGAARSGLIPATVLATSLHLPLLSVGKDATVNCGAGWRIREDADSPKKILLIDDTAYSGRSLSKVKEVLQKDFPNSQILTAAIYIHPKSANQVDYYAELLPGRHYLEWNFFNSIAISRCVFDFDGILCEDINGRDDDDGERYIKALENAIPKHLVRREPIPIIVTARLEKYREVTEAWLKKYGVSCKKLVMGPWKDNKERSGQIGKFKAGVYKSYHYTLFVESDPLQAAEIVALTGKEVLCPTLKRVLIK